MAAVWGGWGKADLCHCSLPLLNVNHNVFLLLSSTPHELRPTPRVVPIRRRRKLTNPAHNCKKITVAALCLSVGPVRIPPRGAAKILYTSGSKPAAMRVTINPVTPRAAVRIVHVFSVSTVVSTLILENTQNPLLFIQSPTSDPLPIAVAR